MHGLDPRVKITIVLLFMLAGFIAQGWVALILVAVAGAVLLAASKTGPRRAWAAFRPFVALAAFVAVFDAFATGGGDVWWQARALSLTSEGVSFAAQSVVRFALVAVATSTLMSTTSATQLSCGCTALLKPLRKLSSYADDLGLSLDMTLRFVPLVQSELAEVKRAQQARLASFDEGGPFARMRAFMPIVVPLFAGCLRRSQDLALAIQNRAYGACETRTSYRETRLGMGDAVALAVAVALLAVTVALRFIG